ncbi:MAG: protein kinase domain-containing protein, partial [Acidobacteriota bacterium]
RGLAAAHAAGLVHRDFKPHNVLRDHDGRVLVTDFGLAHGRGDEPAATAPNDGPPDAALDVTMTPPHANDPVLSSTLTAPGSMLGTPAYMAPEQFAGAPSDPRTDQFAFCVTAWQALTGERPFAGSTVEELHRAALAGATSNAQKLPRAIRAVLARGLAADPGARWPDLMTLLDALERARARPRRRFAAAMTAVAAFAVAGVVALALPRSHGHSHGNALACQPMDEVFADVWSPARRAALEQRVPHSPTVTAIAGQLDHLQDEWLGRYRLACDAPPGPTAYARLGCLLGERDELAAFTRFTDTLPASKFDSIDLWGVLPRVEACDGDSPVAPPLMPEDRKLRDRIVALRARVTSLRVGPPEEFGKHVAELVTIAREIGWQPIEAEIQEAAGATAQLQGHYDEALDLFERAAQLAEQVHDYKVEATARISLLEVEAMSSSDPSDPGRAARLLADTRATVHRAGDDPVLQLSIDVIAARLAAGAGDTDKALAMLETARTKLIELRAFRQVAQAAADEVRLLADRGDLQTAWQRGLATEQAFSAAERPIVTGELAHAMMEVAWRRGELEELHARADRMRTPFPAIDAVELTGKVVGPDGSPVAGARIVAWQGRIAGDAKRLFVRDDFVGDIAITGAQGEFTLHAPRAGVIAAEHDVLRSVPRAIPDKPGPLVIALAPTRTILGRVTPAHARDVHVRFELGESGAWSVAAPVAADGSFRLDSVPPGGTLYATDRERDVYAKAAQGDVAIAWPTGPTLDVIVKPQVPPPPIAMTKEQRARPMKVHTYGVPTFDSVEVWLVRGRQKLATSASLAALRGDVVRAHPQPIGLASRTNDGLAHYVRDGWHVVIPDVAPGEITICETFFDGASCTPFTIPAQPAEQAIVLP